MPAAILAPLPAVLIAAAPVVHVLPNNTMVLALSADGGIAAGQYWGSNAGFVWTPAGGVRDIGGVGVAGISADGSAVAGTAADDQGVQHAAVWRRGAWAELGAGSGNCDSFLSSSFGMSGDGGTVVGLAWAGCRVAEAFKWTQEGGAASLGSSVNGSSSRANCIAGDASVTGGWQDLPDGTRTGAVWRAGAEEYLFAPSGDHVGEVLTASKDGLYLAGEGCGFNCTDPNCTDPRSAWVWEGAAKGVRCLAPPPTPAPPGDVPARTAAFAVSADGGVIGGRRIGGSGQQEAVLWTQGAGVAEHLADFLRQRGSHALDEWEWTGAISAVTPDGSTIAGYGVRDGLSVGYVITGL